MSVALQVFKVSYLCETEDKGPVHTYPDILIVRVFWHRQLFSDIFESANFFVADLKICASTRNVFESNLPIHAYPD